MEIFINIPFEKKKTTSNIFVTGFNDLKESFNFMFNRQPVLWKLSLIFAAINLFLTPLVLIGFPVLITRYLGFGQDSASRLYGYAQGAIGAGAVLGGLGAGMLSKKLTSKACPFILAGCALSMLVAGGALHALKVPMVVYIMLVAGGSLLVALSTLFQIQVMTYLQLLTPKDLIGKVISCFICVCMCTIALGQFIYGIIFDNIDGNMYSPFYAAGLIILGITVFTHRIFYGIESEYLM
ncbi:hypothetical protein AAIR98_001379 [Elusimicrobium simillimum]